MNINIHLRFVFGPPFGPGTPRAILVDVAIFVEYVICCGNSCLTKLNFYHMFLRKSDNGYDRNDHRNKSWFS